MNIFLPLLTMTLLIAFSSCKVEQEFNCGLLPAKIVRYDCDRVIFQILDSVVVGDSSWKDVHTGREYSNVVSYYNTCKIEQLVHETKDIVYVTISPMGTGTLDNCMQCEALSQHPPRTMVDFTTISERSCEAGLIKSIHQ